jgi:hypothetical protein
MVMASSPSGGSPAAPISAAIYFTAWKDRDFDTLRSILADDATFRGPLGTADSGEECVAGLRGMAQMLTDINVVKVFVESGSPSTRGRSSRTSGRSVLPKSSRESARQNDIRPGRTAQYRQSGDHRRRQAGDHAD